MVEKHVLGAVGIGDSGGEVGGVAQERHVGCVVRNRRHPGGVVRRRRRRSAVAREGQGPGRGLIEKDVERGVPVGESRTQIGRRAYERHVGPISADYGASGGTVSHRRGGARMAHQADKVGGPPVEIDVGAGVAVGDSRAEIAGPADERDERSVSADHREGGEAVPGSCRRRGVARQSNLARGPLEEEDVVVGIRIRETGAEVRGLAYEHHPVPVGTDRRLARVTVPRRHRRRGMAHDSDAAGGSLVEENVGGTVCVGESGAEIGGVAGEHDVVAVSTDSRRARDGRPRDRSRGPVADESHRTVHPIVEEHVLDVVGVDLSGDEIGGAAGEHDEPAVVAHRGRRRGGGPAGCFRGQCRAGDELDLLRRGEIGDPESSHEDEQAPDPDVKAVRHGGPRFSGGWVLRNGCKRTGGFQVKG